MPTARKGAELPKGHTVLEKRRSLRFVPSKQLPLVLEAGGKAVDGFLCDLSRGGLMTLIDERDRRHLEPGSHLHGELEADNRRIAWQGRVVHQAPSSRGIAVGIAAVAGAEPALRAAADWLSSSAHAGALHLSQAGGETVLEVIGRLSFEMSHDFLYLLRNKAASSINLTACSGLDSAGLGMLSLAHEQRLVLYGAQGSVRTLLEVARIASAHH